MLYDFSTTPMHQIIETLKKDSSEEINFIVLDPDLGSGHYAGEKVEIVGRQYPHHSFKAWSALAELLGYRICMPQPHTAHLIKIRYQKLQAVSNFHADTVTDQREKYGTLSIFSRINKLEEPTFFWHYSHALQAVKVAQRRHILNLGINKGYEFLSIKYMLDDADFEALHLTGIDHSASAIAKAAETLSYPNITLHCHDINHLETLPLKRQDLIISISTLQSPGINTKTLLMSLVQHHLSPTGALILGFPNARWIDGELIHGAKAPNYAYPEMSLLIKDIYWIKKYLQQHRFRVTITGKEYLFLTATKIGKPAHKEG